MIIDNEYNDVNSNMMNNANPVTARPGHARNVSASAGSVNQQLSVRPLPVHEKECVFNEWGAVLKHQDEIDREIKRQQDDKLRERQKNYKMQLDMQYQEYLNKKKGAMSEISKKEDEMIRIQQKTLNEKQKLDEEKRNSLLNQQKNDAYNSLNEMNSYKREQQSIKEMEKQMYYNRMKMQEEMEKQKRIEDKEKLKSDQINYSRILQIQQQSKLDKLNNDKLADKKFSEAEKRKIEKEEEQRNKFFEKLSKIQETNDIKQKKLQEYMEQDPKELRSKLDEANYLKNLELAEQKGKITEIEQK